MGLDVLVQGFSSKAQEVIRLLTLICTLAFLAIVSVKGFQLAFFNLDQRSPAMGLPMGTVYFAIPIGCLIMLVHVVDEILALGPNRSSGYPGSSR